MLLLKKYVLRMNGTMEVNQNRLDRGFYKYQNELEEKALEVLRSG